MFTGIVEETGIIEGIRKTSSAIELSVRGRICGRGVRSGDSVAVNGCCLTVTRRRVKSERTILQFDLLRETWRRTNLQFCEVGHLVNLERSLRADGRLAGHFVTGHVDEIGTIKQWEKREADWMMEIAAPEEVMRYVVQKGSIAVDGISLTVAGIRAGSFRVWIIPHTRKVTALRERAKGDAVNLEADLLAKYVERFQKRPR